MVWLFQRILKHLCSGQKQCGLSSLKDQLYSLRKKTRNCRSMQLSPCLHAIANLLCQYIDPSVRNARQAPVHTVLAPNGDCILLSQPNCGMGICPELAQVSQIKYSDTRAFYCLLNDTVKLSCFLVHSIVSEIHQVAH